MATNVANEMTDHSVLDNTNDAINGSEVDENTTSIARIMDGTSQVDFAGQNRVDFQSAAAHTTSREGIRILNLDNAAGAVHELLRLEWDPGDGGNMTDNSSGIGIQFVLPDSADNQDVYARIDTMCIDDSTTSEDGELSFKLVKAGTLTEVATLASTTGLTVGVDDTGYDVKFFGASAGAYMEWDESADQLRIMGASADATTSTGKLLLATSLTNINANDVLGKIDFQAPHEAGGTDSITVAASIQAIAQGTFAADLNATDLIFYTGHSEAATEKIRITSQGEIGIGGANYGTDGQVLTSGGAGAAPAWETPTVGDITGVTAGNGLSGGGTSGGVTLALDLSELTDTAIANGDYIVFTDATDSAATVKGDLADVATLFAGTGLTASSSVISIDAAQTVINSLLATDIKIGEDDQTKIDFGTANEIAFVANNSTAMYITSTGGVVHGHTDAVFNSGMELIKSAGYAAFDISVHSTTDAEMGQIRFRKSASATVDGDGVATADGESFGQIAAMGTRSTPAYAFSASIDFEQDGSAGATAAPGRILFKTAAGGSANAEVMRIDSSKQVKITGTSNQLKIADASNNGTIGYSSRAFNFVDTTSGNTWMKIGDGSANGAVYIGDTANGNMTNGLTINQGAADNEILTLQSSTDVDHGITSLTEADTFGLFKKASAANGGLRIEGLTDASGTPLYFRAVSNGEPSATKSTSASGQNYFQPLIKDGGTDTTFPGSNRNCMVITGASGQTKFIFDADGDSHQDVGTAWTNFDSEPDAMICRSVAHVMSPQQTVNKGTSESILVRSQFDDWARDHRADLIRTGLIQEMSPEDHANGERPLMNMTQLARLHNGAIWQTHTEVQQMKEDFVEALDQRDTKIALLEQRLNRLEN